MDGTHPLSNISAVSDTWVQILATWDWDYEKSVTLGAKLTHTSYLRPSLFPRYLIRLLKSFMMDEMDQVNGDIISCKVLQSLPGVIIVCYEDKSGKSYKGALLEVSRR